MVTLQLAFTEAIKKKPESHQLVHAHPGDYYFYLEFASDVGQLLVDPLDLRLLALTVPDV